MTSRTVVAGGILLVLAAGLGLARQADLPPRLGPDAGLKALAERRVALAKRLIADAEFTLQQPPGGTGPPPIVTVVGQIATLSRRQMEAEFDLDPTPAGRIAAIGGHVARLDRWVAPIDGMARTGGSPISQRDVDELELSLLEARAMLVRERDGIRPQQAPDRGPR
jgi:hypothetical protein